MAGADLVGVNRAQPLPRHGLETADRRQACSGQALRFLPALGVSLGFLAGVARVGAFAQQLAGLVCLLACQGQGRVWVGAKAQRFAFALVGVVEPPAVGAARDEQQQIKPVTIGQALASVASLDGSKNGIRQDVLCHCSNFFRRKAEFWSYCKNYCKKAWMSAEVFALPWTTKKP